MKLALFCLVLGLVYSQGAVIPSQFDAEEIIDFVQGLFVDADSALSAAGFIREKRHANDEKVFNLEKLGIKIGIKYIDPAHRWKGGRVHVEIENLKKLVPKAKSEKVDILFNLDGGDAAYDGLFHWEIEYTLEHKNVEKGKVIIDRAMDGAFYKTLLKIESLNNPAEQIIPNVDFNMRSDRETVLQGDWRSTNAGELTFNVDRVPGQSINADIQLNGKHYIIDGKLDKAAQKLVIDIDAGGKTYQINAEWSTANNGYSLKATIDLDNAGIYRVEMQTDKSKAMFRIDFNGRPLISVKVKGKLSPNSYKYEAKYTAVSIGEGKLRLGVETSPSQVLMIHHMPKPGSPFKLELSRKTDGLARHWLFHAERDGNTLSKYTLDVEPEVNPDTIDVSIVSHAQLSEQSLIYSTMKKNNLCLYECFLDRTLSAKIHVDRRAYRASLHVEVTKDSESVLNLDIDTTKQPWSMSLTAPRLLKTILPAGDKRENIWAKLAIVEGESIAYTGNNPMVQEIRVDKNANGEWMATMNGEEMGRGSLQMDHGKSYTFDTRLSDGRALTTNIGLESLDKDHNTVVVKLDGTERKFDGTLKWDVRTRDAMFVKVDAKGENKLIGPYEITRDLKINCDGTSKTHINLTGFTKARQYEVETDIVSDIDYSKNTMDARIQKVVNGKKYALVLNNGQVSVEV